MVQSYSKIGSKVVRGGRFEFKESHFPDQKYHLILYDSCQLVMILSLNFRIYLCRCAIDVPSNEGRLNVSEKFFNRDERLIFIIYSWRMCSLTFK